MCWPAYIPDLNPFKNLWQKVMRDVAKKTKQFSRIRAARAAIFA